MQFFAQLFEHIHPALLLLVIAVGEVKSRHIHAVQHELLHQFSVICIRSHRTYDFGFLHHQIILLSIESVYFTCSCVKRWSWQYS